jgi:hypothetical protein
MASHLSRFAFSLFTIFALGCGGSFQGQSTSDDAATIYRTVVRLNADGSSTVSTKEITRAQQQAEVAARLAALKPRQSSGIGVREDAISVDSDCVASSMWMFDNYNYAGGEICFYGQGTATLSDYWRFVLDGGEVVIGNWQAATKSYFAGTEQGAFHGPPFDELFAYCSEAFGPWGYAQAAGQCAQVSYELMLID